MNDIQLRDTVPLGEIAPIFSRRKWQIAGTFLLVVGVVMAYTLLTPKQYESHMKILVKSERADMIISAGVNTGSAYRGEVSEADINSEIELLNSTSLRREVVTKTGLAKPAKKSQSSSADDMAIAVERATRLLERDLTITPVRKANVIQVDYISRDPRQAGAVLRQLAESYLEEHLRVHGAAGTFEFFAAEEDRYQHELADAESKLEQFRRKHDIVTLEHQKDAILQKSSDAEASLMQTDAMIGEYTNKIADTRAQFAAAPPRIESQNRSLPSQSSVEHFLSLIADLQNRRTQLLTNFRPEDRTVQEVDKEIADTQAALDRAKAMTAKEQWSDVNPVHQNLEIEMTKEQTELAGLKARRQKVAQQVQAYQSHLMAFGNATATYGDLMRDQKKAEDNYLLYAKKAEEARIAESLDRQKIANVTIADPPLEPHLPSKPNVRLNLMMGVLLAGFVSLGVAFGAEYRQQRPRYGVQISNQPLFGPGPVAALEQKAEVETLTGLPVLATMYVQKRSAD